MHAPAIAGSSERHFVRTNMKTKKTACIIGALILAGCAAIRESDQCPIQTRFGQRVPVCASQAIAPRTTVPSAPVLAAVTSPAPSVAASTTSSPSAVSSHERVITKEVAGKEITCHIPAPDYPSEARQAHQTGTVIVRITVWPPNIVKQLTLAESGGNASLDAAAMRAAEGTVCTDAEQRFQLFQSFQFNASKGASVQSGENATTLVR